MSAEFSDIDKYMIGCADMTVQFYTDYALDFSENSVRHLDEIIPKYHPHGAALADTTYLSYAGYVGEVIRRNLGGTWQNTEEHGIHLKGDIYSAFPITWVRKRFEQAEDETITSKVVVLKQMLKLDTALSTAVPAPVVLEDEPTADAAEAGSEAGPEAGGVPENFETFVHAPAVVFLLVAGADGTIDEAEFRKFAETLKNFASHPVPLFKMSVGLLLATFKQSMEQVQQYSPIQCIATLTGLHEAMPPVPDEHKTAYFRALYEFGEKIAKSSGGFLGFGGVSEKEKAALRIIKGVLLGEK